MLHALALAALALAPAQGGQLKLTNVRMTYGDLGPVRASAKFLPGDALFLGFDITGLTIDANGGATYKMETKVTDAKGKLIFKTDPQERFQFAPLKGNVIPALAFVFIGLDVEPGQSVLEVTVEDPKTKARETTSVKYEVLKKDFGIVGVFTSYDVQGHLRAPNVGVVGQTLVMQCTAASFERDPKTKQPNMEFQYQFLDDKGAPLLPQAQKLAVTEGVEERFGVFTDRFPIFLNRPGKFTVQITVTDKVANKKATLDFPVVCLNPN